MCQRETLGKAAVSQTSDPMRSDMGEFTLKHSSLPALFREFQQPSALPPDSLATEIGRAIFGSTTARPPADQRLDINVESVVQIISRCDREEFLALRTLLRKDKERYGFRIERLLKIIRPIDQIGLRRAIRTALARRPIRDAELDLSALIRDSYEFDAVDSGLNAALTSCAWYKQFVCDRFKNQPALLTAGSTHLQERIKGEWLAAPLDADRLDKGLTNICTCLENAVHSLHKFWKDTGTNPMITIGQARALLAAMHLASSLISAATEDIKVVEAQQNAPCKPQSLGQKIRAWCSVVKGDRNPISFSSYLSANYRRLSNQLYGMLVVVTAKEETLRKIQAVT